MLRIEELEVRYGEVEVLKRLSLSVHREEIVTMIGANGAGKTTLLRTISGLKKPSNGRILFEGERIDHLRPSLLPRRGIAHVPEGRHVFPELSVEENLYLGGYSLGSARKTRSELSRVLALFPILGSRAKQVSATLSGGEQQILVIARALMSRPRLVLLDEPSLGLAPIFVGEVFRLIGRIREEGLTVFLVEQNARMALKYAGRGYVIEMGKIVKDDHAAELLNDRKLMEWYLGRS